VLKVDEYLAKGDRVFELPSPVRHRSRRLKREQRADRCEWECVADRFRDRALDWRCDSSAASVDADLGSAITSRW
jgi:hypothetical protein